MSVLNSLYFQVFYDRGNPGDKSSFYQRTNSHRGLRLCSVIDVVAAGCLNKVETGCETFLKTRNNFATIRLVLSDFTSCLVSGTLSQRTL